MFQADRRTLQSRAQFVVFFLRRGRCVVQNDNMMVQPVSYATKDV